MKGFWINVGLPVVTMKQNKRWVGMRGMGSAPFLSTNYEGQLGFEPLRSPWASSEFELESLISEGLWLSNTYQMGWVLPVSKTPFLSSTFEVSFNV